MVTDIRKLKKKALKSFQMLFLKPMNRLTRKAIVLFAMYLIVSVGLTLIVLKVQSNSKEDINAKQIVPAGLTERI